MNDNRRKAIFNEKQTEGIAKILDNLGTAILVTLVVGTFIDAKVSLLNGIFLSILGILSIGGAVFLRGGRSDESH